MTMGNIRSGRCPDRRGLGVFCRKAVAVRLSMCASVRLYWGATTAIFVERFAREFSASVPRDFAVIAVMGGPLSQFVAHVLQQILHHLLVLFRVFFG